MHNPPISPGQPRVSCSESFPSVSVIIPVRNGARTLACAIDRVLAQTYTDGVEIIVVKNGSTDATTSVLAGYAGRITVLNLPHRGIAATRNSAVGASHGEPLAFLDADDTWLPEKLAERSRSWTQIPAMCSSIMRASPSTAMEP